MRDEVIIVGHYEKEWNRIKNIAPQQTSRMQRTTPVKGAESGVVSY
jgi:hypothetical protein